MTGELLFGAVLGIAVQFGVIYGAIRLALVHDRAPQASAPTKAEAAAKAEAKFIASQEKLFGTGTYAAQASAAKKPETL